MSQNNLRICPLGKHMNHLIGPDPIIVISRQPALRVRVLVILSYVVLIGGEDPRPAFEHVDLQDAEAWRVAGSMP